MRTLLLVLLNLGLLGALAWWLRREWQRPTLRRWLVVSLLLKLCVGVVAWWHLTDDAQYFQHWADLMTEQFWSEPAQWWQTFTGEEFSFAGQHVAFHSYSNTFFIMKLLSVLNLASGGNTLLNSLYLTIFSFVGGWQLVRVVKEVLPATPVGGTIVSVLLWPTIVYWTSGITKETILVGSSSWLLALVISACYGSHKQGWRNIVGGLCLALLLFKMRFFFAAAFIACMGGLLVIRGIYRLYQVPAWLQVLLMAGWLWAGTLAASEVSPVFRFNKFSSQLLRTYNGMLVNSAGRPHIEYDDLAPTAGSILRNAPLAIMYTLSRPWPWEIPKPLYAAASLENVALLMLIVLAVIAAIRGKAGRLPFTLGFALLLYTTILAALIGLSTPNLGTLNRYRSVLLPFLLLVLLQNDYAARWLNRWFR